MKLEELKCKNCGAIIEVEENAKNVTCKYCNTTFKIKDEDKVDPRKQGYEFEKGRMEAQEEQFRNNIENLGEFNNIARKALNEVFPIFKVIRIVLIVFVIAIFGIVIFTMISTFSGFKSARDRSEKILNEHSAYENRLEERAENILNNF